MVYVYKLLNRARKTDNQVRSSDTAPGPGNSSTVGELQFFLPPGTPLYNHLSNVVTLTLLSRCYDPDDETDAIYTGNMEEEFPRVRSLYVRKK